MQIQGAETGLVEIHQDNHHPDADRPGRENQKAAVETGWPALPGRFKDIDKSQYYKMGIRKASGPASARCLTSRAAGAPDCLAASNRL